MLPHLGAPELIIILLIVVIVFGVGRLPEIGGALGRGIRDFRKGMSPDDQTEAPKEKSEKAEKPEA